MPEAAWLLAVIVLVGCVVVGVVWDHLDDRDDRRALERYEADRHARLLRELDDQP